jgi:hypothetical protein
MSVARRILRHAIIDIGPLRRHRDLLPAFWRYEPRSASISSSSASSLR